MVVIAVIAVVMGVLLPAFAGLMQGTREQEMRRIAGVLRLIRNEAVLARRNFRLVFDLDEGGYRVEQQGGDGAYYPRNDPESLRPHTFPEAFAVQDLMLFGSDEQTFREGLVAVAVDRSGFVDPFLLHAEVDGEPWTLKVTGFTARVTMESGYVQELEDDER